jgi:hypothetical protein
VIPGRGWGDIDVWRRRGQQGSEPKAAVLNLQALLASGPALRDPLLHPLRPTPPCLAPHRHY